MWFAILFLLGISPRVVLFILWIVTDFLSRAFDSVFWTVMGFIFMPWTTLWCVYVWNNGDFSSPWRIIVLVICILADLCGGSSASQAQN